MIGRCNFLLGFGLFSGLLLLVSGRVYPQKKKQKKQHVRNPPPPNKPPSGFRDTNGFAAFEGEIHQVGLQLDILMARTTGK